MPRKVLLLGTALLLSINIYSTECTLTIGSFNIQRLGPSKSGNATIVNEIVQILSNFDIAVVLEVLDPNSINVVLQALNKNQGPYSLKLSSASGSTTYKEHVAILYRTDKVSAIQAREFPDHANKFERKPYTVLFDTTQASVTTFGVTGVHLKPDAVVQEMGALVNVYDDALAEFQTQNILIAGDFNADCSYLSDTQYRLSPLHTDTRFTFLINKEADTTTGPSNCAYDRFVVAGTQLRAAVVPDSARVIAFPTTLGLNEAQAKAVSDHYPIEVKIR